MLQFILLFIHLKMFKIMHSILFCVAYNNNSSLSNVHVDHNSHLVSSVGILQLTA